MANPEHLAILKQGVEAWNAWREAEPEEVPDLVSAELRGANLRYANLALAQLPEANLTVTDLRGARLSQALLTGARLVSANLEGADLRGAYLWDADLKNARLRGADLSGANLKAANLTRCDLAGCELDGVELGFTVLVGLNLAEARGLDSIRHRFPSYLDVETLARYGASLPHAFIQGIGVPSDLMRHDQAQSNRGLASCFISYSHTDKPFARRVHDQLQARGIRCWLDEKKLKIGEEILPGVLGAIRLHDRVILCCSEASLNSEWVETELEETFEKEQNEGRPILLPLNLDGYLLDGWKGPLAVKVRKRLAADFTGWAEDNAKFEIEFERVVEALRA